MIEKPYLWLGRRGGAMIEKPYLWVERRGEERKESFVVLGEEIKLVRTIPCAVFAKCFKWRSEARYTKTYEQNLVLR